ncbi:hypothetical protein [Deinococcus soli (ex Cha et al. 2016)]|uniref:Uncharacterized protein n=2 Tax=Deinococcus soli (ex Cha et al. 2016) TaxID=1309411 RepID=A0AAE4BNI2_9DEIO|nr:hypothetical protein [Deinococcus soli (ex Cha et al. 2016)]MDR6218736.1 hypothetical protein [Deinococcus soli (ex Cha et al. 2016)]MDR6328533.1 hypothetical protein [Deinococcus soli (ex Cha et al. 2016)]MDR6753144.1 hypothetical protein [Deinococcus soli (ex Cha et al. 2016)]
MTASPTSLIPLQPPTITHGSQSVNLTQLLRHPRQPALSYQLEIHCDSYDFQSSALVRVTGHQMPLVRIPYADMDAIRHYRHWGAQAQMMSRGRPLPAEAREALLMDHARLIRTAEQALGLDVLAEPAGETLNGPTLTALKLLIDAIDRGEIDQTALAVLRSAVA